MNQDLKNGVPIIDRMMDLLDVLQRRQGGASIRELATLLSLPRSTVYRVLNTLEHHSMVRHTTAGSYVLGPRLLALAAQVVESSGYDLSEVGTPYLENLSTKVGSASKISVRDGDGVLVIVTVHGVHEYGLTIKPGRNLPFHAGAAGKLMLAFLEEPMIEQILQRPLTSFTPRTLTEPAKLRVELRKIRRQGWSMDRGEYSALVTAFAAPIRDPDDKVIAAVSVPFLNDKSKTEMEQVRYEVIEAAQAISNALRSSQGKR